MSFSDARMRLANDSLHRAGESGDNSRRSPRGDRMALDPTSTVDLKRMRAVVEVARAESVTAAAEILGLTQSAVSRSVSEVEEALGVRLFERLPRGIEPTPAGRQFAEHARRLLGEVDALVEGARRSSSQIAGRLRIGLISCGGNASWAIARLARLHPDVAIEVLSGSPQSLCPKLLHGEIELIVGTSSYLRRWRELEVTPLAPLHFACMVRKGHPLTERQPSELEVLAYPVVLPETIEPTYSDLALRFQQLGLPPFRPRYVTDDFALAQRIVRGTEAFYPLMHTSDGFGGLGADFALLRDAIVLPAHQLCVARDAHRPWGALADRFVLLLRERYGEARIRAAG
jgi:DNA-binding transcriptional LysR family regulator